MTSTIDLPDFIALWDFNEPAATEQKFKALLPQAEASGNPCYHLELLTQIARTYSLQLRFDEAHTLLDQIKSTLENEIENKNCPTANIRYHLERGRTFNSSDHKPEALAQFKKAYEIGLNAAGNENLTIDAAHMLAIAEVPENQLAWNLKALALAEAAQDETARNWQGSLYNNLGWTCFEANDFPQAMQYFEKALAFRTQKNQPQNIRIAKWTIARCHRALKNYQAALKIQQALLSEYENKDIKQDGYVYEELGELYLLAGETVENEKKATKFFGLAYDQLAQDDWFVRNEAERLHRIRKLGGR